MWRGDTAVCLHRAACISRIHGLCLTIVSARGLAVLLYLCRSTVQLACMERPISFCAAVADYQETEKSRFCESSPSDLYFWFGCSIIRAFVDTFLSYSSTHNHSDVCRGVVHPFTLTLLYSPPGSEHLHFLGPAASYQSTIVLSA